MSLIELGAIIGAFIGVIIGAIIIYRPEIVVVISGGPPPEPPKKPWWLRLLKLFIPIIITSALGAGLGKLFS